MLKGSPVVINNYFFYCSSKAEIFCQVFSSFAADAVFRIPGFRSDDQSYRSIVTV